MKPAPPPRVAAEPAAALPAGHPMPLRRAKLLLVGAAGLLWAFGWLWVGAVAAGALQRSGPAAQAAGGQAARIIDFDYRPDPLQVQVGAKVTWTNTGSRPHTVTDRGGTFDTNAVQPGRSASITFTVPGSYAFFCRINPSKMNGVIEVTAGAQPARVNRVQAVDPALPGEKLRFDPAELQVPAGSTLLVANIGGKPHTLTADDGSFDTGTITPGPDGGRFAGTNATVTLARPGRFPFHCEVHPKAMKGVLTVVGTGGAAGGAPASNAPRQASVDMKDFAFDKQEVSVAPGGQVTWKNTGQAPHTATFDDVQLDTGNVAPGGQGKLTAPDKPGSYSYKCSVHPARMRGVLVVVGANTADPTQPVAAAPAAPAASNGGGGGASLSYLALVSAAVGAFLAGFGVSAFARARPHSQ
jgi:plastocyanin